MQDTKEAISISSSRKFAEERLLSLPAILGAEFATIAANVRYEGRKDVMLVKLKPPVDAVGFFTQSSTAAAPVLDCQNKIRCWTENSSENGLAIVANSGNANAFTSHLGESSVNQITSKVTQSLGIPSNRVLTASTGVIGESLNTNKLVDAIDDLKLQLSSQGLAECALSIMTTDTFPKAASVQIEMSQGRISIAGIAKGSGMIAPNMATMLAFVFTDAKISRELLYSLSQSANKSSFNAITIDGDTSTNDTLIVAATNRSETPELVEGSLTATKFAEGLSSVMLSLAEQIVRDGEGASKFVRIHVVDAKNKEEAYQAAKAIAESLLVKTAIAGEDPNWGRIVMAVGKSGVVSNTGQLAIWFGTHLVANNGMVAPTYSEDQGLRHMKDDEIDITVSLGVGVADFHIMTCDLTHKYVSINADYRT